MSGLGEIRGVRGLDKNLHRIRRVVMFITFPLESQLKPTAGSSVVAPDGRVSRNP
jgi:hypothetical protein